MRTLETLTFAISLSDIKCFLIRSVWMDLSLYLILWFLDVTVEVDTSSLAVHVQSVDIYAVHVIVKWHAGSSDILY